MPLGEQNFHMMCSKERKSLCTLRTPTRSTKNGCESTKIKLTCQIRDRNLLCNRLDLKCPITSEWSENPEKASPNFGPCPPKMAIAFKRQKRKRSVEWTKGDSWTINKIVGCKSPSLR
eukprot:2949511-Amphidinium_carterae.2